MTLTSVGFKGTVSDLQWTVLSALLGHGAGLLAAGDFAVTPTSTKGQYAIGTGGVFQDGVLTRSDAAVTFPSSPLNPANGQWFLLAMNRVWATTTAALAIRNGPTTAATAPGGLSVPASFPASSTATPGTDSDVGIAWIWVGSGASAPIIVPLLLPPSSIAPRRGTATARDAMYAALIASAQGQLVLQGKGDLWNNDAGTLDRYYARYDLTANPQGARTAGWYPVAGALPFVRLATAGSANAQGVGSATNSQVGLAQVDSIQGRISVQNANIVIVQDGLYDVAGSGQFQPGGSVASRQLVVTKGDVAATWGGQLSDLLVYDETNDTNNFTIVSGSNVVPLKAGDVLRLAVRQNSGATINLSRNHDVRTFMSARYIGPVQG